MVDGKTIGKKLAALSVSQMQEKAGSKKVEEKAVERNVRNDRPSSTPKLDTKAVCLDQIFILGLCCA